MDSFIKILKLFKLKNMKILKKITILITITFLGVSCEDYLDLTPPTRNNVNDFYKTPKDFNIALFGVYNQAQSYLNSTQLLEVMTDNAEITYQSAGDNELTFDEINVTDANSRLIGMWRPLYFGIAYSNTILNKIDPVEFSSLEEKNQYTGEALFMRAWNYFNLVRVFGNVPISTQEVTDPAQKVDFTLRSIDDIYAQIEKDLSESIALLPIAYSNTKGRASKGAAIALLGKVNMYQEKYQEAVSNFESIFSGDYNYTLGDFGTLFSQNNGNLSETIFEIEFISGSGEGNNIAGWLLPDPTGSGLSAPTDELIALYDLDDIRAPLTALTDGAACCVDESKVENLFTKYFAEDIPDRSDGSANWIDLRYADVLLLYAEALNEISFGNPNAFNALNDVRFRAGLLPLTNSELQTQSEFRLSIELERRLEFANERQRWFDLVRTGRVQEVMNAHFVSLGNPGNIVEDHQRVLPIPLTEKTLMGI